MNKASLKSLILFMLISPFFLFAQVEKNTGKYVEYSNKFWKEIKKENKKFKQKKEEKDIEFHANFEEFNIPKSKDEFKSYWHFDPADNPQANTSTCWDYCGTSFFESEIFRLRGEKIKISEMYTAYWEFVEKAAGYIDSRGETVFPAGSQSGAVITIYKKYGAVPQSAYSGKLPGQKFHDQSEMFKEMKEYLKYLKKNNFWNKEVALGTIKSILDHYMGVPPISFEYNGKEYTPEKFEKEVVALDYDNYVEFTSSAKSPFYKKTVFPFPDNWRRSDDYHNVPLEDFMAIIKNGVRNGYTICIGGDVSEAGHNGDVEAAVIPSFDIPSEYIDQNARDFRIDNGTTDDDHGIHLVGYKEDGGKDWYLIKDSGSSSRNGANVGYYFFHEDFVKLKMLSFMIHKDVAKEILEKFE